MNWEVILWTCITLVVIMGVFGLLMSVISATNMKKRRENMKNLYEGLAIGSQVMFAGGSPFNNASMCMAERPDQRIEVLAGTNLPMIIEGASMMAAYDDPLELAETLIPTGKDYIVRFELVKHEDNSDEDGI